MNMERLFEQNNISEEGIRKFRMTKAVQDAMFDGSAGKLINFRRISKENLVALQNEVNEEISWRDIPNGEKGRH